MGAFRKRCEGGRVGKQGKLTFLTTMVDDFTRDRKKGLEEEEVKAMWQCSGGASSLPAIAETILPVLREHFCILFSTKQADCFVHKNREKKE